MKQLKCTLLLKNLILTVNIIVIHEAFPCRSFDNYKHVPILNATFMGKPAGQYDAISFWRGGGIFAADLKLGLLSAGLFKLCTYQCYPGGRGRGVGGGGDFDILSKIFVKNHSPGTTYFGKKSTKIPTQGQGSYVKCSYPEASYSF